MATSFKQSIRIGKNIEGIFKLPCVAAIRKDIFGAAFFELYGYMMQDKKSAVAREGDWLCENYKGHWTLFTNDEYINLNNE
jgi:hypothetical protein